jgi:hypothetical protein
LSKPFYYIDGILSQHNLGDPGGFLKPHLDLIQESDFSQEHMESQVVVRMQNQE